MTNSLYSSFNTVSGYWFKSILAISFIIKSDHIVPHNYAYILILLPLLNSKVISSCCHTVIQNLLVCLRI
jgi:hypothetical protein